MKFSKDKKNQGLITGSSQGITNDEHDDANTRSHRGEVDDKTEAHLPIVVTCNIRKKHRSVGIFAGGPRLSTLQRS